MTRVLVVGPNGKRFIWDPDGMYFAIRSAMWAKVTRARSKIKVEMNDAGVNLYNVCTDWKGIRKEVEAEADLYWTESEMQLRTDPANFYNSFVPLIDEALTAQAEMDKLRKEANDSSMAALESAVDAAEFKVKIAKTIRDGSALFLVVAGSIFTGGAVAGAAAGGGAAGGVAVGGGAMTLTTGQALTGVAVGSTMSGAFTYQDTGNVGSAMIKGTGTFITGAIGVGAAAGPAVGATEAFTILVIGSAGGGTTAGLQALVEGKELEDAATTAAIGTLGGIVGGGIGGKLADKGLLMTAAVSGIGMDMATGQIANMATADKDTKMPAPKPMGYISFTSIPEGNAEAYVKRTCLQPLDA